MQVESFADSEQHCAVSKMNTIRFDHKGKRRERESST